MESTQTTPASSSVATESKLEKQSARGAMCKQAEDAIARRAQENDESLVQAIITDPLSDFVCVPASYVAGLPELVSFAPKLDAAQREKFLISVLESSQHLTTQKDKEGKIIIRTEYKRNPRNTLIMHNVPADANESDLREIFLSIDTAASVSFKKDVNSCWLATFDTEANAVASHTALFGKKLTVKGSVISIGLRATRFVRVAPPSTTTTPQPATGAPQPSQYGGMRQPGMPQGMRQQYAFPQQYWMSPMQPYWMQPMYGAVPQQRPGVQHQPWMGQQQKSRSSRPSHPRYTPAAQQQQQQHQQRVTGTTEPAPAAAPAAPAPAPAAPAAAAPTTAAPQQPQQQPKEGGRQGGRGGRNYRGRGRGQGGNRGHGGQSSATTESAPAEGRPSEQPAKHQRQYGGGNGGAERQEQPAKPQKKPTADSFPPLA